VARWKKKKPAPLVDPATLAADVEHALEGGADVVKAARKVLEWLDELELEQGALSPAAENLRRYFHAAVQQWEELAASGLAPPSS
jgi:hypothetical protein